MDMTRVEKYKTHRSKLISSGDRILNFDNKEKENRYSTSSTLPLNEVYQALDEDKAKEDETLKFKQKQALIRNIFIGAGIALVFAFLVIFAFYVFK